MRRPRRAIVATAVGGLVAVLAGTLLLGGCSSLRPDFGNAPVPTAEARSEQASGPVLVTAGWGVVDGMLSVVVRNATDRTLRYAQGVVTARTADDRLVASSLEKLPPAGCCAVRRLGPGQEFGFYLDVGAGAERISRVDIAYRDVTWDTGTGTAADPGEVEARPVQLRDDGGGTVALVELTSSRPVDDAVVQAFLTDADGGLVAVVSGRWTCVRPGTQAVRMQLFHRVPPGTEVDRVVAYPAAPAGSVATRPRCDDTGSA